MDDLWECQFCKALNGQDREVCWHCPKTRQESDLVLAKKKGASAAERQALEEAHLRRRLAREQLVARAQELQQSGRLDLASVLKLYVGSAIGVNLKDPVKVVEATLTDVQADHFAVTHDGLRVRFPFAQVLRVSEPESNGSVKAGGLFGQSYQLVVEVFHMVVYKGAVGVGFSVPL